MGEVDVRYKRPRACSFHYVLVIDKADTRAVGGEFRAAGERKMMVMRERGARDFFLPVGVSPFVHVRQAMRLTERSVGIGAQHRQRLIDDTCSERTVIMDTQFAFTTFEGGHLDDTGRTTGTELRRLRGVFEDPETLDIRRIDRR